MRIRVPAPFRVVVAVAAALGVSGAAGLAVAGDPPAPAPNAPAAPEGGAKPAEKPADKPAAKPAEPLAPAFTLKDVDGRERSLAEFKGKWVVLEWTNYSCPYVRKHYDGGHMQGLQKTYTARGVVWLSICSSAPAKQGHMAPDAWKKAIADRKAVPTAVLLDPDGAVGRAYTARRTPEIRVIGPSGVIRYSGAIDDNPAADADPAKSRNYLVEVLDAVLAGKPTPLVSTTPYGCTVKY